MAEAKLTTDHKTIRKWAESRGGRPSHVEGTGKKDDPGLLRLDFGPKDEALDPISWEISSKNSSRPISRSCIRTKPPRVR